MVPTITSNSQSKKPYNKFLNQDLNLSRDKFHFIQDFRLSSLNVAILLNSIKLRSKTRIFFPYFFSRLLSHAHFCLLYFLTHLSCRLDCTVAQFQWERLGVKPWTHPSGRKRSYNMGMLCSQSYKLMRKINLHLSLPKTHSQLLIFPPK